MPANRTELQLTGKQFNEPNRNESEPNRIEPNSEIQVDTNKRIEMKRQARNRSKWFSQRVNKKIKNAQLFGLQANQIIQTRSIYLWTVSNLNRHTKIKKWQ